MTREGKNVWLSIKNEMVIRMSHKAIGMNELNKVFNFAEKIFDEHEAQLKAKDEIIKSINIEAKERESLFYVEIKAKNEEIERLKVSNKGYLIVLNDKLDRNNFLELQYEKYRKTLAMLFWEWRKDKRIYEKANKQTKDKKRLYVICSELAFKQAYAMLKGE